MTIVSKEVYEIISQEEKNQEVLDSQSKVGAAQSDQINFDEGD